jgi:type I restriction enzyme, S subunit
VSGEKTRLVPKLRFPEFRGAEWVQKKLEDVAPLQRGFDLPSDLIRPGNIPIVYSNGIQKYHEIGMATAPGLVTGRSGTIGKLHFIEHGEYWPHNTSLWVTDFKSHVPRFVYYLYASIGMGQFSSGSGVPTLNRNDVHAFSSAVPISLTEQQKIADCLSSMDELIAAQARKIEALKTHKKGLMQQLFPIEGETQPRLRFPEFQDAGEWEETRLGKLGKLVSGLTYSPDDVRESGLLVLRSSNVQNSEIALDDCVYVDPSIKGANLSQPEDILICVRNGSKALIGKCALIPQGMPLCTPGAFMTVFRAETPSFVFQLFQSDKYQKQVAGDQRKSISEI